MSFHKPLCLTCQRQASARSFSPMSYGDSIRTVHCALNTLYVYQRHGVVWWQGGAMAFIDDFRWIYAHKRQRAFMI